MKGKTEIKEVSWWGEVTLKDTVVKYCLWRLWCNLNSQNDQYIHMKNTFRCWYSTIFTVQNIIITESFKKTKLSTWNETSNYNVTIIEMIWCDNVTQCTVIANQPYLIFKWNWIWQNPTLWGHTATQLQQPIKPQPEVPTFKFNTHTCWVKPALLQLATLVANVALTLTPTTDVLNQAKFFKGPDSTQSFLTFLLSEYFVNSVQCQSLL